MKQLQPLMVFCLLALGPASAQTVNINKAENAGECSFTVVNAVNSTFKVACGGKGLQPNEAKQLSQILSLIKKDDLQFSRVLQSLQTLAEEQKAEASKPKVQNCPDGFCNAGPVQAPQTINDNRQFRVPTPPPSIDQSFVKISGTAEPKRMTDEVAVQFQSRLSEYRKDRMLEPLGDRPGLDVFIKVAERFPVAAFLVTCDKPCLPSKYSIKDRYTESSIGGRFSQTEFQVDANDPRRVLFRLNFTVNPGQTVRLRVRSKDGGDLESAAATPFVD